MPAERGRKSGFERRMVDVKTETRYCGYLQSLLGITFKIRGSRTQKGTILLLLSVMSADRGCKIVV